MKQTCTLLLIMAVMFTAGCSIARKFDKGRVAPATFYTKISFDTVKSVIMLPFELEGRVQQFLFDTGARLTSVQREELKGKRVTVRGATNRTIVNGTETIKSLKIGDVDFINTFATNGDMEGLKEQIPNFGGILGRSVIDKANWLINYPKQEIEIGSAHLIDESFTDLNVAYSNGAPYVMVSIAEEEYRMIIDMGSSSILNLPDTTDLAKELQEQYEFKAIERNRYTVGGAQQVVELITYLPEVSIGEMTFRNVRVNINKSSQMRLGMPFFKDYLIYIDNTNRDYKIKLAAGTSSKE
ncbi:MAG: aspartyl protease family protein [Bacteroidota bacterium]